MHRSQAMHKYAAPDQFDTAEVGHANIFVRESMTNPARDQINAHNIRAVHQIPSTKHITKQRGFIANSIANVDIVPSIAAARQFYRPLCLFPPKTKN